MATHKTTIDVGIERGASYAGILALDEVKKKLQGDFSIATGSTFPMYKWFPESKCYGHYYEPPANIGARKAATLDKSIGNLLLSNLPGWAALPERETSAMVYSSRNTANGFSKNPGMEESYPGRMYRAVPTLNAKLVIAPAAHIRYSFTYALGEFGVANDELLGPLGKLQSCFHSLFRACGIEDGVLSDWQLFLAALHSIAFEQARPVGKVSGNTEMVLETLIRYKTHIIDLLDKAFSPLHNGFSVIDYADGLRNERYPDCEIWMASPCLLIEEGLFEEMGALPI